nr:DUF6680 family protein [uncultured Oscillibacter sp.]
MFSFETVMTIVNVAAVVLSPVIAVLVGQFLQNRAEKRKDKMDIFKTLMVNRYAVWSVDSVRALNSIDIIFSEDKEVRSRCKEYYDKLCIQEPNASDLKRINTSRDKLLEAIACSLGYKDKVTWETIQNPYIPKAIMDAQEKEATILNGQAEWAKMAGILYQLMNKDEAIQKQLQGEPPNADA